MKHYCPFTSDEEEIKIDLSKLSFDELEIDMTEEVVKKARKPKEKAKVSEDRVTLAQLCEELEINPTAARRKLREAEIQRPEGKSWTWKAGSRDLEKIRKTLSAA